MYESFVITLLLVKYVESKMEGFIIGGSYADMKQYPHHVYINIQSIEPCACGGSILNQDIILTAGHCVEDVDKTHNHIQVYYGSDSLKHVKGVSVKSFMIHENYNARTVFADLALMRCKTRLELGNLVKKVVIMRNPPIESPGFVSGWGYINARQDTPELLRYAPQDLQKPEVCKLIGTPKGAFCAGPVNGLGHPAAGDSGGALVIHKFIQIGIVSFKSMDYTLVAYTNVSFYYSWIHDNAKYLYCTSKKSI